MGILGWLRGKQQERDEEPKPRAEVVPEDVQAAEERLREAKALGRDVRRVAAESARLRSQNMFSERIRAATGKVADG